MAVMSKNDRKPSATAKPMTWQERTPAPSATTGDTVNPASNKNIEGLTATELYSDVVTLPPTAHTGYETVYLGDTLDNYVSNIEKNFGGANSLDYAPINQQVYSTGFYTDEFVGPPAMEGLQDNGYSEVESSSYVVNTPSTGIDIQSYLNQMMAAQNNASASAMGAYGDALAAQERARREAMEQAKMGINSSSDKALREAYIQNRKARRDMPQQLSAQGISGGLSESTAASLANQYGENRNALEMARQQALAELASDYAAGRASDSAQYNAQIANLMGQQAQQNLALQQWGMEQMLEQQNNANRRVSYDQNPYFGRDLQAVMSGELTANDLYANAERVVNQYGLDGLEYLLEYAQTPVLNYVPAMTGNENYNLLNNMMSNNLTL